jgi:ABC-type dipeptide/oligopeptide/nickel transport system permease component
MLGVSVPHYWLGVVLVIIFSVHLGWRASRATPIRGAIPGHRLL